MNNNWQHYTPSQMLFDRLMGPYWGHIIAAVLVQELMWWIASLLMLRVGIERLPGPSGARGLNTVLTGLRVLNPDQPSEWTQAHLNLHGWKSPSIVLKELFLVKVVKKKKEKSSYSYLLLRYELKETLLSDLFHICYKNSKTEKFSRVLFYFSFFLKKNFFWIYGIWQTSLEGAKSRGI